MKVFIAVLNGHNQRRSIKFVVCERRGSNVDNTLSNCLSSKSFMVLQLLVHRKSDRSRCVKNKNESLREKHWCKVGMLIILF